jgi:hypothetical protein
MTRGAEPYSKKHNVLNSTWSILHTGRIVALTPFVPSAKSLVLSQQQLTKTRGRNTRDGIKLSLQQVDISEERINPTGADLAEIRALCTVKASHGLIGIGLVD